MTGALLDLAELAARAEVPVERLRHYAEAGLLAPARRDRNLRRYPPGEASTARVLASAALTTAAHAGPCGDDCGCTTALAAAGTTYHFPVPR